ncbi:DUF6580 family putative transport protein [Calycomorphotria hydatis]|uniref:Rod shape-determining protein MreD n=1 Tax=Calycomorphotria hydatis TaxID=2528027 RepID=A0A517TDS6_9PLAN|nr:DUF6580 family putative transport protein [Calycomorphotria hydatis]QDT66530.1 hypothetical protein V22_38000 [Calycomorphotria hydatis]
MMWNSEGKTIRAKLAVLLPIYLYCVLIRLVPFIVQVDPQSTLYPWNFSILPALAIFGGIALSNRWQAALLPLIAWFVGDVSIGAITGHWEWAFHPTLPFVYAGTLLLVCGGFLFRGRPFTMGPVVLTGLLGAVLFYLVTNFGTWLIAPYQMYDFTLRGLAICYWAALPFFRNSLISMAVFLPLLLTFATSWEEAPATENLAEPQHA